MFANAGRMGPRQLGFMREALTRTYALNGVLILDDDSELFDDVLKSRNVAKDEKDRLLRELEMWKFVLSCDLV